MVDSPILFIDATPRQAGRTVRYLQLERARARSHTAALVHQARKRKLTTGALNKRDFKRGLSKACQFRTTDPLWCPPPTENDCVGGSLALHTPRAVALAAFPIAPVSFAALTKAYGAGDTPSKTAYYLPRRHRMGRVFREEKNAWIPPDYACFRGMRIDPFNCIPYRGSPYASLVVDHYSQHEAPNNAAIYKIFNVTNIYTQYFLELFQDEDYFHCALASTQSMVERITKPEQPLSLTVLQHWNTAISRLRKRLVRNNGVADPTIVATVLLFAASARTTRDWKAHEVHKRSLIPLIASCGGLDRLGPVKFNVLQWDSFWALNHGVTLLPEARRIYDPVYPPYPFEDELSKLAAKLPLGFRQLAEQRRLTVDVIEVLARTSDAEILMAKQGYVVDATECFKSGPRRYSDFWEACPCLGSPGGVDQPPDLEKLIVLALIIYCLHTFSPARVVTVMYGGSRQRLTTDLLRWDTFRKSDDEDEEDVRVWIWLNVIDAWRKANDELMPQGFELIQAFKPRFAYLGRSDQLEAKAGRFFFNDKFGRRCLGYIDEV